MKNSLLLIVLLLFSSLSFSQKEVPSPEIIKKFKQTKTYIVLDNNPLHSFNFKIKDAAENSWKTTPFEFISYSEFEEKRTNEDYSFITLDQVWFSKDRTKAQYNFLCLSLGGDYKNAKDMPQLCTLPVSYNDVDEESYVYKLSGFLQIIQDHVKMLEENPAVNKINVIHQYNKQAHLIKTKTLYVIKDELSKAINTEAKFKKIYPYDFKFVSRETLEEAIDNKVANVIFLHKVGPEGTQRKARCWKTMIGTDDSKLYYFNYHMISSKNPDGLLEKDLKRIARAKA